MKISGCLANSNYMGEEEMNKIIMFITIIAVMIAITGCSDTDKNTGNCNGVKYLINESHCVENCAPDCYGWVLFDAYPSHCYGFYWNGQATINGCTDGDWLCDKGSYICTSSVHSYAQDKIDAENAKIATETAKAEADRVAACWANGTFYNYTFDIMHDYNLSCDQLGYINDHLIDKTRQVDGGYISGHYSGFVSYGEVEGHLY